MTAYPQMFKPLYLGFTTLKVSTVMIFDLGVYLCVWGGLAGVGSFCRLQLDVAAKAARSAPGVRWPVKQGVNLTNTGLTIAGLVG